MIGVILVVLGVCLKWAIFPAVVKAVVRDQMDLSPGKMAYDGWVSHNQNYT